VRAGMEPDVSDMGTSGTESVPQGAQHDQSGVGSRDVSRAPLAMGIG
jgi:hypothetical protein